MPHYKSDFLSSQHGLKAFVTTPCLRASFRKNLRTIRTHIFLATQIAVGSVELTCSGYLIASQATKLGVVLFFFISGVFALDFRQTVL